MWAVVPSAPTMEVFETVQVDDGCTGRSRARHDPASFAPARPLHLRCTMKLGLSLSIAGCALVSTARADGASPARRGFVEGGLAYGWQMSNSQYLEVRNGTRLDSPSASGLALDVAGGFAFVPNLAVVGDLQYARATTIRSQNNDGDTSELFVSFTSLAVGLRTLVPIGRGEVYAQLALGVVLPFETERDEDRGGGETRLTTVGYNSGLGARGEMGYHFPIGERMYLGAGFRVQAFATDNVGRERVRTDRPSGQVERDTYTTTPSGNNTRAAEALSVQDFRVRLGFGVRF